ncbi:MAG: phosphoglycolate phosphatase [Anaerolineaceae bacterium]|nr:MAG: phosphoglycolate phosphatase [Anaerolineaceae bacterium]
MYKHIIWDFDGTLFDSYPVMVKAAINVLEEQGIYESYDKIMSLMKMSFTHLFDYFNETYYISDILISNFNKYRKEFEADNLKPYPYVVNVCRRICESNGFNHLYTHRGKSSIEYLKKHHMYEYFSGLITRESNFNRKPEPDALIWLTEEYKIDKGEALMIGDRDIDILAAKNAGIDGCYYKSYPLYECEFAKYTITDYSQLIELLEL